MHLVQADGTRKASDKGEKSKDGDEKELESIGVKTEGEWLGSDIVSDCGRVDRRLGGSSQESRKSGSLLALKFSQTILIHKSLVLREAALGGFLVVEGRRRSSVDGGVDEDRGDGLVAASADFSQAEILGASSEGWVSLARWRGAL